nr:hypothetical protein [Emcibacter nanhaiensis]
MTGGKVFKDAANDSGFPLVDGPLAGDLLSVRGKTFDDVIAKGAPATGLALFDASPQAAPGFIGEVFEVKRVHGALEADMQVVHFALGEGDDAHIGKAHAFIEPGDIFLVAGQAVQSLGQDDGEVALHRVFHQGLDAGAHQAGPAHGAVLIGLGNGPALLRGQFPAQTDLVFNGGFSLVVGRIAGVNGDFNGSGVVRSHGQSQYDQEKDKAGCRRGGRRMHVCFGDLVRSLVKAMSRTQPRLYPQANLSLKPAQIL